MNFLDRFLKNAQISNFMNSHPGAASCFLLKDRQTGVTKLVVAFLPFFERAYKRMQKYLNTYVSKSFSGLKRPYCERRNSSPSRYPLLDPVVIWVTSFFFLWRCDPTRVMASSFLMFLYHTQRRTTVGRTTLDE